MMDNGENSWSLSLFLVGGEMDVGSWDKSWISHDEYRGIGYLQSTIPHFVEPLRLSSWSGRVICIPGLAANASLRFPWCLLIMALVGIIR